MAWSSNAVRGAVVAALSDLELAPARTRQRFTPVAPFHLTYTVVVLPLLDVATAGWVVG